MALPVRKRQKSSPTSPSTPVGQRPWAAFNLAKEVWSEDVKGEDAKAAFQREMIFPIGEPNTAYAKYFKGNSYLAKISDCQIHFSNVTFEPGCRNNWHIHHATKGGGQMLVGVAGRGWYQEEGKPAQEILPAQSSIFQPT